MARKAKDAGPALPYSREELMDQSVPAYTGESLKMISFPLGGIGTGTIGLGGRGQLRDWETFNAPKLNYRPPYTAAYIFARQGSRKIAKVLERKLLPPHHASGGMRPVDLAGLPRLDEALFVGTYPMARVYFEDDELPVDVSLEAFNPMIPNDPDDSAIPAAIFVYRLKNRTRKPISGSIAISTSNTVGLSGDGVGQNVNAFRDGKSVRGIYMTGRRYKPGEIGYGTAALTTTAKRVSYATDFDEPGWFDKGQKVWDDYKADGNLDGPRGRTKPSPDGHTRVGMLTAGYNLKPGASTEIVFIISWSFPYRLSDPMRGRRAGQDDYRKPILNHYAGRFGDAWKAAKYVADNFEDLRERTRRFERALFSSTLPGDVLDAVSSQMAIIRTNTTLWLDSPANEKDGRIFGYEGSNVTAGCCPMNCTHVWNYEQSLAHLYPSLERTMRATDYVDNIHSRGSMSFRTRLPLQDGLPLFAKKLPAADGQFGTVVKAYREWRISGDEEWLRGLWSAIKKSISFAWKGFANWDADKDGVLEGVQHNTYDIEFHGPNSMCNSLYLAALAAGAEMAEAMGDKKAAAEFAEVLAAGRKNMDRKLYNGEFYIQRVVTKPRPKYQYGYGCLSDQLLGQWAAHVAGLGHVMDPTKAKSAISAVFRHNFKANLSSHECCQRTFALGYEAGLLICTWPNGRREEFPFPYSDEVWSGIEYQVAAHLIYEGLVEEGLTVVSALRGRHDGVARNPWNEYECGDHYARAMASWSLLTALSGQQYDGRSNTLTFRPVINKKDFRCLFTAAAGYGTVAQKRLKASMVVTVSCQGGKVKLAGLELARAGKKVACKLNGEPVAATVARSRSGSAVQLKRQVTLGDGDELVCRLSLK